MLTDEQIEKLGRGNTPCTTPAFFRFARAIEAAARSDALEDAISKLNASIYNLTKRECIEELRTMINQPAAAMQDKEEL